MFCWEEVNIRYGFAEVLREEGVGEGAGPVVPHTESFSPKLLFVTSSLALDAKSSLNSR